MADVETRTDDELLAEAVAVANIPTLLMTLVQLTGEMHWLDDPYRIQRQQGMGDNDTGGLPEDRQAEVREAALEAISAWKAGRPVAIPDPDPQLLVRMLSWCMGETVPDEYGEFTKAQLGHKPLERKKIEVPPGFKVLVIGAGVSGIAAGANLQAAGVPFEIVEKKHSVGGTWLENHYPGAGVDTPNHLYSFSFAQHDWKMYFCLRDELWGYLESVADRLNLRPHIRFQTEVVQARYQPREQRWAVALRLPDGSVEETEANIVISGTGIFNPLVFPDIEGLDSFAGPSFHTAAWRDDVDLTGKKVAIIGNGASCMQIGPEIQDKVEHLTIFQRSNHWAAPFEQFRKPVPEPMRFLFREVPIYQAWYRVRLGWTFNDRTYAALHKDPNWEHPERSLNAQNDAHRAYFTKYIQSELGDRQDLFEKVLPTYPPFGKRMLMDNGWYRMLRNPKVELVTEPVAKIEPDALITADGSRYEADVLVLATGFDVLRFITTFEAVGREGRSLREVWEDDNAKAYIGTVIPAFPNFFTLYGPNLQPGHGGSLIFVVEMQVNYIMSLIEQMAEQGLGSVEIRQDVHDAYNERVDAEHENMVWTHPGMTTYYRNERGRIVVNSPYRNVDYFAWTRHADLAEYVTEPVSTEAKVEA
ncbi:MAG: NAD(P)/FAD-dependent oxidoreductase [Acidimicrobiia bacterium]|nr:NAD(P)/FAD-dependent oxidoreductase [Acidimicrobiia bacterium]